MLLLNARKRQNSLAIPFHGHIMEQEQAITGEIVKKLSIWYLSELTLMRIFVYKETGSYYQITKNEHQSFKVIRCPFLCA